MPVEGEAPAAQAEAPAKAAEPTHELVPVEGEAPAAQAEAPAKAAEPTHELVPVEGEAPAAQKAQTAQKQIFDFETAPVAAPRTQWETQPVEAKTASGDADGDSKLGESHTQNDTVGDTKLAPVPAHAASTSANGDGKLAATQGGEEGATKVAAAAHNSNITGDANDENSADTTDESGDTKIAAAEVRAPKKNPFIRLFGMEEPAAEGDATPVGDIETEGEEDFAIGFDGQTTNKAQAPKESPFAAFCAPDTEEAAPEEDIDEDDPVLIFEGLAQMHANLILRTALTGIFAAALVLLGLMAQGILPAISAIDPTSAPTAFLLVALATLLISAGISYTVFIDGILGLWRTPSPDSAPALASIAAALQLLACLVTGDGFDPLQTTLFAPLAGLLLFADALGTLLMTGTVRDNFALASKGIARHCAYRLRDKDLLRTLTSALPDGDAALLVSRPTERMTGFLSQSFSPRESDRFAQKIAYGLLGAGVLCAIITLGKGGDALAVFSSFVAALCIGAPLSATLLAAVPSTLMQRSAASANAIVPGWQGIEALGEIDAVSVDACELFPPMCAQLRGIKTFQKERLDLAILYATSILIEGCDTLHELFLGMIEHKTDMLYPVKDLKVLYGKGFVGWCENYRVLLGTRQMMLDESVALPPMDYENRYSKNGTYQVLYLAVSGQLYAMFMLQYIGEKRVAASLKTLRREQIRVLVRCSDPTLDAARIEEIYRLQDGVVNVLTGEGANALETAIDYRPETEGAMLHVGSFASYVAGLKAAAGAADAEHTSTLLQLCAVGFSVLLCIFLAMSGGLLSIALLAATLYQIAWSALTVGVSLTKKYQ